MGLVICAYSGRHRGWLSITGPEKMASRAFLQAAASLPFSIGFVQRLFRGGRHSRRKSHGTEIRVRYNLFSVAAVKLRGGPFFSLAHACKRGWEDRFRTRSKSADDQESRPVLLRTSWWLVAGFILGSIFSAAILLQAKKHASMSTRFDVAHEIGDNRVCIGSTNTSLHNTLYLGAEAVVKDTVHTDATPFCQVPLSKVLPSIDGARKEGISFEQSCYHDFGTQLRFCDGDGNITDHSKMYQADSQSGHESPVSV